MYEFYTVQEFLDIHKKQGLLHEGYRKLIEIGMTYEVAPKDSSYIPDDPFEEETSGGE